MTVRPPMLINHLRLEVVPKTVDHDDHGFELRLMDAADTAIMTFALPESIARALAASHDDWQIIMSPSGSVEVYNDEDPPQRLLKIGLDELIRQNLTPDMLEDEPDLKCSAGITQTQIDGVVGSGRSNAGQSRQADHLTLSPPNQRQLAIVLEHGAADRFRETRIVNHGTQIVARLRFMGLRLPGGTHFLHAEQHLKVRSILLRLLSMATSLSLACSVRVRMDPT